jgi:hypothetical protein
MCYKNLHFHSHSTYLYGLPVPVFWTAPITVIPMRYSNETVSTDRAKKEMTLSTEWYAKSNNINNFVPNTTEVFLISRQ